MRTRFDQFAKQMTIKALAAGGTVRTDEEVSPDAGHIDIWFTPHEVGTSSPCAGADEEALAPLGMLGRMAKVPFTMEPFHQTPDGLEVMSVVCKHHYFRSLLARGAAAEPAPRGTVPSARGQPIARARGRHVEPPRGTDPQALPVQWIVSSGRPALALSGLCFTKRSARQWGPGVYDGPRLTHTRLIVVAELPATRDTLLLRLMGAGRVLAQALEELRALPSDAAERAFTLPLLLRLRIEIPEDQAKRTENDEEYIMATRDILDVYIEKLKKEGRKEGSCETQREDLIDVYTTRFGAPPASVAAIIAETTDPKLLRSWLKLVAGGSAREAADTIRAHTRRVTKPVAG